MNKKEEKLLTEELEKAMKSKEAITWEALEDRSESSMSPSQSGLIHSPRQLNAVIETLKVLNVRYNQYQVQSASWSPSSSLPGVTIQMDAAEPQPEPPAVAPIAPYDGMVRGYRAYQLDVFTDAPIVFEGMDGHPIGGYDHVGNCDVLLRGAIDTIWEGRRLQADCAGYRVFRSQGFASPGQAAFHLRQGDCACGIYATFAAPAVKPHAVIARCCLWGAVVVHETGYRAQFAEIEELFVDQAMSDNVVAALERRYEVPVTRMGLPRLERVV